jgi:8-oxo-dGTP pyrophosphatase MutT (NUDIX family)
MNAAAPTDDSGPGPVAGQVGELRERLSRRISAGLPGREAQRMFEPELGYGRHFGPAPHDVRRAAVALLLYERDGVAHLPLIVRPQELSAHGGQISLPGGLIEPDESAVDAALRELQEELGVSADAVEPLGPLTPLYIFGTKFHVRPWLATIDRPPAFVPNPAEVAELLEVPLTHLCDPANRRRRHRAMRGLDQQIPYLDFHGHAVWGATAMILGELIALCDEAWASPKGTG